MEIVLNCLNKLLLVSKGPLLTEYPEVYKQQFQHNILSFKLFKGTEMLMNFAFHYALRAFP